MAIDIPTSHNSGVFKWMLFISVMPILLSAWLEWRWFRAGKNSPDFMSKWLTLPRLRIVCILSVVATVVSMVMFSKQPMMPVYGHLLWNVITR